MGVGWWWISNRSGWLLELLTELIKQSYSKLSELVGPGKELLTSKEPTLCAVIQKGILISKRVLVELGKTKTEVHSKDMIAQL